MKISNTLYNTAHCASNLQKTAVLFSKCWSCVASFFAQLHVNGLLPFRGTGVVDDTPIDFDSFVFLERKPPTEANRLKQKCWYLARLAHRKPSRVVKRESTESSCFFVEKQKRLIAVRENLAIRSLGQHLDRSCVRMSICLIEFGMTWVAMSPFNKLLHELWSSRSRHTEITREKAQVISPKRNMIETKSDIKDSNIAQYVFFSNLCSDSRQVPSSAQIDPSLA